MGRNYEYSEWLQFECEGVTISKELAKLAEKFAERAHEVTDAFLFSLYGPSKSDERGVVMAYNEDALVWNTYASIVGHGVGLWEEDGDTGLPGELEGKLDVIVKKDKKLQKLASQIDMECHALKDAAGVEEKHAADFPSKDAAVRAAQSHGATHVALRPTHVFAFNPAATGYEKRELFFSHGKLHWPSASVHVKTLPVDAIPIEHALGRQAAETPRGEEPLQAEDRKGFPDAASAIVYVWHEIIAGTDTGVDRVNADTYDVYGENEYGKLVSHRVYKQRDGTWAISSRVMFRADFPPRSPAVGDWLRKHAKKGWAHEAEETPQGREPLQAGEWRGWNDRMPVQVVTRSGTEEFRDLAMAQRKYPMLDPRRNTDRFTWAMKGEVDGRRYGKRGPIDAIRFEDWSTYQQLSSEEARPRYKDPEVVRHKGFEIWSNYNPYSKETLWIVDYRDVGGARRQEKFETVDGAKGWIDRHASTQFAQPLTSDEAPQGGEPSGAEARKGGSWNVEVWFATSDSPRIVMYNLTREQALREARSYVSDARRIRIINVSNVDDFEVVKPEAGHHAREGWPDQFDEGLKVGNLIEARWTWGFESHTAPAEVVKLSKKSLRAALLAPYAYNDKPGYTMPKGHELVLPRAGTQGWTQNNGAYPPNSPRVGQPLQAGEAREATPSSSEDAVPWVRITRDPEQYAEGMKRAKEIGPLDSGRQVYELLGPALSRENQEVFLVVLCNLRSECLGVAEVHRGERSRVSVSRADILQVVTKSGADHFMVVHNHPSGDPTPSDADRKLTKAIMSGADNVDIPCVDHVVIGMGKYYSFSQNKTLKV